MRARRRLPDRRSSEEDRRRRHPRPACRWTRSRPGVLGAEHRAGLARAVARVARAVGRLRSGLQLRLRQHAVAGAARRRRCRWRTIRASCSSGCSAAATAPIRRPGGARREGPQHPRLPSRQESSRLRSELGTPRPRQARRVPRGDPRRRTANPEGRSSRATRELPSLDQPAGIPATLRRAREADVRPAGAGLPGRPDARHHVHGRPRDEPARLPGDRRARRASPAVASRRRPRKDSEA